MPTPMPDRTAPLQEEVALCIGLAARVLPGADARALLQILIDILGEPITAAKLQRLRLGRWRQAGQARYGGVEEAQLKKAFNLLKGIGVQPLLTPAPMIESGVYCELSGSVRVACASNSGERIDGHFGSCQRFLIYQVSPDYIRLIDIREPASTAEPESKQADNQQYRAQLLRDCSVLYTTSIGGPAAAKVVRAGLHPIKIPLPMSARDTLQRLQTVLAQDSPPPWLAKAMGSAPRLRASYGEA